MVCSWSFSELIKKTNSSCCLSSKLMKMNQCKAAFTPMQPPTPFDGNFMVEGSRVRSDTPEQEDSWPPPKLSAWCRDIVVKLVMFRRHQEGTPWPLRRAERQPHIMGAKSRVGFKRFLAPDQSHTTQYCAAPLGAYPNPVTS